jgi:hypothetical protein
MGKVQDDVMHDWNNTTPTTRQSFTWMKPKLPFYVPRVFRLA